VYVETNEVTTPGTSMPLGWFLPSPKSNRDCIGCGDPYALSARSDNVGGTKKNRGNHHASLGSGALSSGTCFRYCRFYPKLACSNK